MSENRHKHYQAKKAQERQAKKHDKRQVSFDQLINIRSIACKVVHDVAYHQKSLTTLLPIANEFVDEKDRGLLQELVFGCCRWYYWLESLHNQFLEKPLHRNDKIAETLLKVGAYQLHFMRIPDHAALNETVEAAGELGLANLKGLINAVLRKIADLDSKDHSDSAILSHPTWMQEKTKHNWPDLWQSILQQNNQHPPMTLRVNPLQATQADNAREEYLVKLEAVGIGAEACTFAKQGINLLSPCPVTELPSFEDGAVSVQDEAAQLCCELLDLKEGQNVLDACAAPGGKTCAMLENEPQLNILALDADKSRCELLEDNLSRLKLSATVTSALAEFVDSWWNGEQFDRILLDAPCSATGVIRRHPDIKLLRQEGDIKRLADLQLTLLTALWPTLKQGGKLLYATCSIYSQENSRIIERFLKQELSATLSVIDASWGIDTGFGRQLFPQENAHDGFFYACLTKEV